MSHVILLVSESNEIFTTKIKKYISNVFTATVMLFDNPHQQDTMDPMEVHDL